MPPRPLHTVSCIACSVLRFFCACLLRSVSVSVIVGKSRTRPISTLSLARYVISTCPRAVHVRRCIPLVSVRFSKALRKRRGPVLLHVPQLSRSREALEERHIARTDRCVACIYSVTVQTRCMCWAHCRWSLTCRWIVSGVCAITSYAGAGSSHFFNVSLAASGCALPLNDMSPFRWTLSSGSARLVRHAVCCDSTCDVA